MVGASAAPDKFPGILDLGGKDALRKLLLEIRSKAIKLPGQFPEVWTYFSNNETKKKVDRELASQKLTDTAITAGSFLASADAVYMVQQMLTAAIGRRIKELAELEAYRQVRSVGGSSGDQLRAEKPAQLPYLEADKSPSLQAEDSESAA